MRSAWRSGHWLRATTVVLANRWRVIATSALWKQFRRSAGDEKAKPAILWGIGGGIGACHAWVSVYGLASVDHSELVGGMMTDFLTHCSDWPAPTIRPVASLAVRWKIGNSGMVGVVRTVWVSAGSVI